MAAEVQIQETTITTPTPELQITVPSTPKEMLDEVNKAIYAILVGGQEYKIGSKRLTRADIRRLYDMRNDLTAQVNAENQTGLLDDCYVGIFDGR